MATKLNSTVSDYEDNFNSDQYLKDYTLCSSGTLANASFLEGFAALYHHVFSTHPPGQRLLDVGSGPTVWHVMSASARYRHITLSDPLPQNRRLLQQYMTDSQEDDCWTEHFKLTAKLEGDAQKWQDVRDRLRACIKEVLWCDILQEHPLGSDQPGELYDCVMSSLCLEGACQDVAAYSRAVQTLVSLVKPGGRVVLGGVLQEACYEFGGNKFAVLPITVDIAQQCVESAGCTVLTCNVSNSDWDSNEGIYVLQATKQ